MGEIRDYKCTYTNSAGVRREVTKKTGMRFPEAYYDREGMKALAKAVEDFYVWYLPRLAELADERLIISLCPKMAYAAVDTGHARIAEHPTAPGISYLEALLAMRGRAKIGGQSCPKTVGSKVKDGIFRELVLE